MTSTGTGSEDARRQQRCTGGSVELRWRRSSGAKELVAAKALAVASASRCGWWRPWKALEDEEHGGTVAGLGARGKDGVERGRGKPRRGRSAMEQERQIPI